MSEQLKLTNISPTSSIQSSLIYPTKTYKTFSSSEWGTFKDSLRAPIHNWFTYPAGFSHIAVTHAIDKFSIKPGNIIYDPFAGMGTTNLAAKSLGIDSIGMEAHPFIFFVAKTKAYWNYSSDEVIKDLSKILNNARKINIADIEISTIFPELVLKCFSKQTLVELYSLREAIKQTKLSKASKDLLTLALACILRSVANVATGWPYIAPNKKKSGKEKDVFSVFSHRVKKMLGEVQLVKSSSPKAFCKIINGDARNTHLYIEDNSIDFIFTSPPYLNNYDYADRTRLETYFFGWAKNWKDISDKVRKKLIISATTQINRADYFTEDILSLELKERAPAVAVNLQEKINRLSTIRKTKGGKKSYDILVGGYFNDMFQVLLDCFRILKKGKTLVLILGDSAPYGVHISTDLILGEIAKNIGFSEYRIEELRKRGGKWKDNPQRHKVELREVILYLTK